MVRERAALISLTVIVARFATAFAVGPCSRSTPFAGVAGLAPLRRGMCRTHRRGYATMGAMNLPAA
jgi:hypothetical protein